ncbi:zinc-binding dehydrogenase [Streptomyces sp. NPDC048527]|uniref:zinc-binding dehydrogenase n=1 Tax=Streptomyces sp. NPDC048527 TaxID=3365568 RepID=UPI00371E710A
MGADEALLSTPEAAAEIRDRTSGRGADVVLDFVGSDATLNMAAEMVKRIGLISMVGRGGGTLVLQSPERAARHLGGCSLRKWLPGRGRGSRVGQGGQGSRAGGELSTRRCDGRLSIDA